MNSKDIIILEKLKIGNSFGFKELFDFYYMPLCVYSLKYCDSFTLAEDIVQDLFIKFWDEKLYIKLDGGIGPYLFKSVKNNTLQVVKKKSKYRFEEIENHVNKLMGDEIVDMVIIERDKEKLFKEIELLPSKGKAVFKAIVLDDLKYKDVASKLGISVNTVKTHYSRALKQLRKSLNSIIILLLVQKS